LTTTTSPWAIRQPLTSTSIGSPASASSSITEPCASCRMCLIGISRAAQLDGELHRDVQDHVDVVARAARHRGAGVKFAGTAGAARSAAASDLGRPALAARPPARPARPPTRRPSQPRMPLLLQPCRSSSLPCVRVLRAA
jgi:hypothetical protein